MRQEYPNNNEDNEENQNYSLTFDKIEFDQ